MLSRIFHSTNRLKHISRNYWTPKQSNSNSIAESLANHQNIREAVFNYRLSIKNPNLINPENYLISSVYEVDINYVRNNVPLKRSFSSNNIEEVSREVKQFITDHGVNVKIGNVPLDHNTYSSN